MMAFSVLMYHEIRKEEDFQAAELHPIDVKQAYKDFLPSPLFITLEKFEQQMEYLFNNGFHTLSLEEVKAYYEGGNSLPEKSILLTFDDCFQSIKEYAYPILKKYQFHATAFVVTGWLHDNKRIFAKDKSVCLSTRDLEEMKDVFEYANHTHQMHIRTSESESLLMTSSKETFAKDLDECNEHILINHKNVFAYPFGLFNESNILTLKEKEFKLAFTCENGHNDMQSNPLLLKRNAIPYLIDLEAFKKIVTI
ncbi:polysaccharide deacetylase family protein [Niallia circulans]|uniref:polysaccharide deacetylase family protein n=2 Tax=Niallia circulans TaxID=1397 RepID=UPI001F3597BF|nr:polysaccharide deacetylase family protein [Niallia circulans]MED3838878.1 polysaccharide deacetylase family protein [Niallia circulans]MED4245275.1 polysaccharide deacetylase family protein [Niallia circulans]MED4248577.1 polysaccharide deacetylase family protein [Niallia circulans]